ncbi:MAG: MoaD/ThiS family protein [Chloroflexota bacterium]|nr:MoaD/ThiS family protein [Chloroflexota bacterium]
MKVKIAIHGYLDRRFINLEKEVKIRDGSTAKDLFSKISKDIKVDVLEILTKGAPVTMVNTERLEIPKDLSRKLVDGDEVVILQPLAGG